MLAELTKLNVEFLIPWMFALAPPLVALLTAGFVIALIVAVLMDLKDWIVRMRK